MKLDLIYVFKHAPAKWEELRYSLRSLSNLNFDFQVTIIADELPSWLTNVRFIKHETKGISRYLDVSEKVRAICQDSSLSQQVIFMYDDIYFIKPTSLADIDVLYAITSDDESGEVISQHRESGNNWSNTYVHTLKYLKEKGMPALGFETHLPRLVHRLEMLYCFSIYPINQLNLQRWTIYGNHRVSNGEKPVILNPKAGIKAGFYGASDDRGFSSSRHQDILTATENALILNHDDNGLTWPLKEYLQNLFKEKSIYES